MCRDKKQLNDELANSKKVVSAIKINLKENSIDGHLHGRHMAEFSDLEEDNRILPAVLEIQTTKLRRLNKAVVLIENGKYDGICMDCESPIPTERLEAIPGARRCAPCHAKYDGTKLAHYRHHI